MNHAIAALSRALDLRYGGEMKGALHRAADLFEAAERHDLAAPIRADALEGMSDARSVRVAAELWGSNVR